MRFKDFEIRPYCDTNTKSHTFELVKYYQYQGREVCYVVAWIDWNKREPCWEFRSVGTRFIDDYEDGLCEYIKKFLELVDVVNRCKEDEEF